MRSALMDALFDRMAHDQRIFFLVADMGINMCERFEAAYPTRFLNVGIAEQNLIGVAAGLVNTGFRPFVYTISNFLIHRAFEQIRNDILLHNIPVTLLGTSTGYDNAPLGPTHHIVDDWGPLAAAGGELDVYCPASKGYAGRLVARALEANRPAYVRIPKSAALPDSCIQDMQHFPGDPGASLLIGYGSTAGTLMSARQDDPSLGVLILQKLLPIDLSAIVSGYDRALVVEDHFPASGLFARLCQTAMINGWRTKLVPVGPGAHALTVCRDSQSYFQRFGMDAASLLRKANDDLRV